MGNQRHLDGQNCFVVVVKITDLLVLQDVERFFFRFVFVHLKIFHSVSCDRERVQENFFTESYTCEATSPKSKLALNVCKCKVELNTINV